MAKLANVLVYEWKAWEGFLISHLIADYCRLTASYDDTSIDLEKGLSPNIKAVLLQINLSRSKDFPRRRRELINLFNARGILVLNSGVEDITKRNLHRLLETANLPHLAATPQGNADEVLFVKSNLNYGGVAEQNLPEHLHTCIAGSHGGTIDRHDGYYVAPRKDLPLNIFSDDTVVVERYISNPEHSFYRVYGFGDGIVIVKAHSKSLIKKISGSASDINYCYSREEISKGRTDLPPNLTHTLQAFINAVALDYFCLDIVHDLSSFYIIDLNLTPWSGVDEQSRDATDFLIQGGLNYLGRKLV